RAHLPRHLGPLCSQKNPSARSVPSIGRGGLNSAGLRLDKAQIVRLIKRIADESGGIPAGQRRFTAETGVKDKQWRGRHRARWGDAVKEAGFAANQPAETYGPDVLAERTISLCRR